MDIQENSYVNQKERSGYLFRFSYKILLDNDANKKMIIIMMNPSESNIVIDRIKLFARQNDYNQVIILNMCPLCESNSAKVNDVRLDVINCMGKEEYLKIYEENFIEIKKFIDSIDDNITDIYLATGIPLKHEAKDYFKRIYDEILSGRDVFYFGSVRGDKTKKKELTKDDFTFHPSRQDHRFFSISNRYQMKIRSYSDRKILAPNGLLDGPIS